MTDQYTMMALLEAANIVPYALVETAAMSTCNDVRYEGADEPCEQCLTDTRQHFAYVYAFKPEAFGDPRPQRGVPCVACVHAGETCVFHQGADHWISREWLPPIVRPGRHRRTRWHIWKALLKFVTAPLRVMEGRFGRQHGRPI